MGIKIKDILKGVKIGTSVGKVVLPGGAGKILDVVNQSINDKNDPHNEQALKALAEQIKEMAKINNEQTEAILALHQRVNELEGR